jgi:hypothetical protein
VRSSVVVGGLLIVVGAAVAGFAATRGGNKTEADSSAAALAQLDKLAQGIDSLVDSAKPGLDTRVKDLTGPGKLVNSLGTDAGTVEKQLEDGDLNRSTGEGMITELGHIKADGSAVSLMVRPVGAPPFHSLGSKGVFATVMAEKLTVTEVVFIEINTDTTSGATKGVIAVSRQLDLAALLASFKASGGAARLDTEHGSIVFGSDPGPAASTTRVLKQAPEAKLVAAINPAKTAAASSPGGLLWAGLGGAALGIVALVMGMRGGAGTSSPAAATGAISTVIPGPTSGSAAAATSSLGSLPTQLPESLGHSATLAAVPATTGGTIIGRYQLLRRLGSGGMADVFLARVTGEAGFAKQVALKILHPHLGRFSNAVEHFLDEARLASGLTHPNIVQIMDLGKADDGYFIAMEYIDGSDLDRVVRSLRDRGEQIPLAIAMTILRRACDGLHAAHSAQAADGTPLGIVHRDVKSANVLVSRQGQVKIGDFGIAKAATQVHTTKIGETKGTLAMMAPEQRMGQPVDVRADVYAVAAVGYELFTCTEVNLDMVALAQKGVEGWPHLQPPSQVRPGVPPELDGILLKAMSFEPGARPASCAVLEDQLTAVANQHGLLASDKDIARWFEMELAHLKPATGESSAAPGTAQRA